MATRKIPIKIKLFAHDAKAPFKSTKGAACYDIYSNADVYLYPQRGCEKAYMVSTGFGIGLPEGYHAEIYLRSSTGLNTKLRLANGTGIIDSDYTGEVKLLVENIGPYVVRIEKGERIAQMLIVKNLDVDLKIVTDLEETERGSNGFGSTGKD